MRMLSEVETLQVKMSEEAYNKLNEIAKARGFKGRAAYIRNLIIKDAPELEKELNSIEWGGDRKTTDKT